MSKPSAQAGPPRASGLGPRPGIPAALPGSGCNREESYAAQLGSTGPVSKSLRRSGFFFFCCFPPDWTPQRIGQTVLSWSHLHPTWTAALSCLVKLQSSVTKELISAFVSLPLSLLSCSGTERQDESRSISVSCFQHISTFGGFIGD